MTALAPCPAAVNVTVELFGEGPGVNFDFATLSFQLPMPGTGVCAPPRLPSAMTRAPANTTAPTNFACLPIIGCSFLQVEARAYRRCGRTSRMSLRLGRWWRSDCVLRGGSPFWYAESDETRPLCGKLGGRLHERGRFRQ